MPGETINCAPARAAGWPGYPAIARDARAIERIEEEMKSTRSLNPLPAATQYLRDQLQLSQVFKELFFTDRNGYNAAISNLTSDFVQSDEEWWVNAWTKGLDIGGTTQNPLMTTKTDRGGARVTYDASSGVWSIAISVRIDDPRTKEPLGVMKGVLDISAVQTIASRTAEKVPGGEVKVIVAATGDVVADTSVRGVVAYYGTHDWPAFARLSTDDDLAARLLGGSFEQVPDRIAHRCVPATHDADGAGGIGRNKFDLHPLPAAERQAPIGAPACQDTPDDPLLVVEPQEQVDEAGARDFRLFEDG